MTLQFYKISYIRSYYDIPNQGQRIPRHTYELYQTANNNDKLFYITYYFHCISQG